MGKMRSKWQQFDKNYFTCLPAYGITACYLLLPPSKFWSDFPIIFLPLIFADDLILIVQYFSYQQPPSPEKMTTHTTYIHATKIINWKTNICHMIYLLESKHVDEKEINYIYIYKDL